MNKTPFRILVLFLLMSFSFVLAFYLKPDVKMSINKHHVDFNQIIPLNFLGWQVDDASDTTLIDPEVKATLSSVYSQTVSRVYVNSQQQRVMLSVAYGGDQEEVMQVHKPEVCYTAQGFTVRKNGIVQIEISHGVVNAMQLITKQAERVEPVTYWITIGNTIALDGLSWRWERIKYGLTGTLPDGLLFRVSSIGEDTEAQYKIQHRFINDLLGSMAENDAKQIIGSLKIN